MSEILPQDNTPRKQCSRCPNSYPATPEFFARSARSKDGLQPECKVCKKQRYLDNKEKLNAQSKAWREANKEHVREQKKRYAEDHKEHLQEYHKQYYQEHKEDWKEWGKQYYQEHRDEKLEYQRQYSQQNKEKISKRSKIYREKHKQQISERRKHLGKAQKEQQLARRRQYYATHKNRILNLHKNGYRKTERCRVARRASWHKREAIKKAIPGNYTDQQIQAQLERQKYCCYYAACGFAKFEKVDGKYVYHIEHTVPLSRTEVGPRNDIDYIVLACSSCNLHKGTKLPHEWPEGGRLL